MTTKTAPAVTNLDKVDKGRLPSTSFCSSVDKDPESVDGIVVIPKSEEGGPPREGGGEVAIGDPGVVELGAGEISVCVTGSVYKEGDGLRDGITAPEGFDGGTVISGGGVECTKESTELTWRRCDLRAAARYDQVHGCHLNEVGLCATQIAYDLNTKMKHTDL